VNTVKKTIIEILSRASKGDLPDQVGPEDTLDTIAIYAELVDAGYLTGCVTLGPEGRPCNVAGARITISGRGYLEQLENERAAAGSLSGAKKGGRSLLKLVVLPIVIALIVAWLIKRFGLK
jgi:hypothetical protein